MDSLLNITVFEDLIQSTINKCLPTLLLRMQNTTESNRPMTKKEACQYAGIGIGTLNSWISRGLTVYKVGRLIRIYKYDVDDFIKNKG